MINLRRKLTARYLSALTLIGALLTASCLIFVVYFKGMRDGASLINISGRQRMLSQRIVLLVHEKRRESVPKKAKEIQNKIDHSIEMMEQSHEVLLRHGNEYPFTHQNYFGENSALDKKVRTFLSTFKALGQSNAKSGSFPIESIDSLLIDLDRAVGSFQTEVEQHEYFLIKIQLAVLLLGLLGLIFSGLYIFKPMTAEIVEKTENLLKSNKQLSTERNRVKLLSEIATIANESKTFDEAMNKTIYQVCQHTSWPIGHAYIVDTSDPNLLLPTKLWHLNEQERFRTFKEITERTSLTKGIGLPGRVLQDVAPVWVDDVAIDKNFPRNRIAINIGVHSAFAFPILLKGSTVAVLEFFSEKVIHRDEELLNLVTRIGQQLEQVYIREKSKDEINQLNQTLEQRVRERTQTILEQQETITANSKMSCLGEMASGIAHEINTPLATISTLSSQLNELLDDDPIDKKLLKGHADKIEQTTYRIAKIIKGLRTFSRDAADDPFVPVVANELIEDVLSLCKERFALHGIGLNISFSEETISFKGRPAQLEQVLINLLNNSYDAISPLKEKWVKIDFSSSTDYIEIAVTDSGSGIPIDVQKNIFQPFYTTKSIGKGTGIGLSISKNILQSHKGDLLFNPSCKNTQFILRIPKDLDAHENKAA